MRKKTKAPATKEVQARVYCGPSIKGIAKEWTVYSDEIPQSLREFAVKCPAVGQLIVSTSKMAETKKELKKANSAASVFYNQIINQISKGGN